MEQTIPNEIPSYEEVVKSNEMIMDKKLLSDSTVKTMMSRAKRVFDALGSDAANQIIGEMTVGTYDKDFTRQQLSNAFRSKEMIFGDGEDSYSLNALRNMLENHFNLQKGNLKEIAQRQRNVTRETVKSTTVKTQESSGIEPVSPIRVVAAVQPQSPTALDREAEFNDHWDITLMFFDGMRLRPELKEAAHELVDMARENRRVRQRWDRVKYGLRGTGEEF